MSYCRPPCVTYRDQHTCRAPRGWLRSTPPILVPDPPCTRASRRCPQRRQTILSPSHRSQDTYHPVPDPLPSIGLISWGPGDVYVVLPKVRFARGEGEGVHWCLDMVQDRRFPMVDLTAPHQFHFPFPLYWWMKELPPGSSIVPGRCLSRLPWFHP